MYFLDYCYRCYYYSFNILSFCEKNLMQEARGRNKFDGEKINGADHSKWNTSILQREVSCQAALGLQYFS